MQSLVGTRFELVSFLHVNSIKRSLTSQRISYYDTEELGNGSRTQRNISCTGRNSKRRKKKKWNSDIKKVRKIESVKYIYTSIFFLIVKEKRNIIYMCNLNIYYIQLF